MKKHINVKILLYILSPSIFVLGISWFLYALKIYQNIELVRLGIFPQKLYGLPGILTSGLIHGSRDHILSNTLPFLVLSTGVMYFYPKSGAKIMLSMYVITGFLVWCVARPSYHIGLSGLVYAIASFLFFVGIFTKSREKIAISLLVALFYGSMVWGILPLRVGISYESHLAGAIIGLLFGYLYKNNNKVDPPSPSSFSHTYYTDNVEIVYDYKKNAGS